MADYPPLTHEESITLSASLIEMAVAGERLSNAVIGHTATPGSPAAVALSHPLAKTASNGGPVRGAHETMFFAALAGWDHARALGSLLRATHHATVSLATVTRGGVEDLSRVSWIISSGSIEEMVQRYYSLAIADLKFFIKNDPTKQLRTMTGSFVDAEFRRDQVRAAMSAANVGVDLQPSPTGLARDFLSLVFNDGGGGLKYSQLSSVAHGESIGVNAFVTVRENQDAEPSVELVQARVMAIEYAGYLVLGGMKIGNAFVEEFEPPIEEIDRWKASRDRATARLLEIDRTRGV